jgi:hypothetical protein
MISIALMFALVLSLAGCGGSYGQVNLQEPVEIPENGVISQEIVTQLQKENAIGTFQGVSNDFRYEWTIFGSDITDTAEINLKMDIRQLDDGIQIQFSQEQPFGFPALLSIYLADHWDAQSATAYRNDVAVYSVSLTGSRETIVNLSVRDTLGTCVITADPLLQETLPEETVLSAEKEPAQTQSNAASGAAGYLSAVTESSGRVYSDGGAAEKDKYLTDPVPEGKPMPVEPEDQQVNTAQTYTCTFSIECSTILNNLDMLDPEKLEMVPSNGTILATTSVTFYAGESVFDVLQRLCRDKGIHMEASWTPIYNSAYIEGIHNLYEFDCGSLSGWMYRVNGWYPNYGCSRYQLQQGDVVQWRYTCDMGSDIGGAYAVAGQSE